MSEHVHTLIPFESVGPYHFGKTPDDCAASAGPHERVWESRPMREKYEQRGPATATYRQGTLIEVAFSDGAELLVGDINVFGDATALAKLRAVDPSATEQKQWLNLPSLGLCLGGFGKRKLKEGRTAVAYARSQLEEVSSLGTV